jgi:hypothetical protein
MASTEKMAAVIATVVRPELTCLTHHCAAISRCKTCISRSGMTIRDVIKFASTRLSTNLQKETNNSRTVATFQTMLSDYLQTFSSVSADAVSFFFFSHMKEMRII